MSGVDDVNISLLGGVVTGTAILAGGAVLLAGGALMLLYKGVKTAVVAGGRAAERAHAMEQAKRLSRERTAATERTIAAMEQDTRQFEQRLQDAGLLMDKDIQSLHTEIERAKQWQNERLAKQAREHQTLLEQQERVISTQQNQLAEQTRIERMALEQYAAFSADQLHKMRTDIQRKIAVQRETLEGEMAAVRIATANEIVKNHKTIESAVNRLDSIGTISGKHEQFARYWIEQTRGLLAGIESFDTKSFNGGKEDTLSSKEIRTALEKASSDIQTRAFESAITTGRRAFQDAFNLKERIFNAENEKNKVCALWHEEAAKISEDIADDEQLVYEMETSEGIEKIPANLDYWTNGQFKKAKENFEALQKEMADVNTKTAEDVKNCIQKLEAIGVELAVIRQIGKANFVLSHNRYAQGCHLADMFGENFAMTDCEGDYVGEEQRDSYVGIYKNPATNDTIVVKIQPKADESGIMNQNSLEFHYFNESNNEEQREQWRQKINEQLGGKKLCCRSRKNLPSDQKQMANIGWVRQQKHLQTDA